MKNRALRAFSACSLLFGQLDAIDELADPMEFHQGEMEELVEMPAEPVYDPLLLDLEKLAQDFVLETKRIQIPGYPGAFNPSVVRYGDAILMCFRIRDSRTGTVNKIGLVYLDENLDPIGNVKVLEIRANPLQRKCEQDPRLIKVGGRFYVVYSNFMGGVESDVRRVFVSELRCDGDRFYLENPECLSCFEGERKERWEKNWSPFDYHGDVHLAYSVVPHRILRPIGGGMCETAALTKSSIRWDWGVLRGGTPALEHDGEYLTFFHSCKDMTTANSQGKHLIHYFMGAYTFSLEPPFHIKKFSRKPIFAKGFYSPPYYKTWKPLRVVFPGGFIFDSRHIWVFYGRQDHEICVVKLDKDLFMKSLVPVPAPQP